MKKKLWLANFITIFHFVWALLIIFSLPISLVWPQYSSVAALAILLTVASWLFWRECFLRTWENNLRQKYDPQNAYDGEFLAHYLKKYFHLDVPLLTGDIVTGIYLTLAFVLNIKRIV